MSFRDRIKLRMDSKPRVLSFITLFLMFQDVAPKDYTKAQWHFIQLGKITGINLSVKSEDKDMIKLLYSIQF